jgi:tetrahydromethanopterin S-methyltransferase subunit A
MINFTPKHQYFKRIIVCGKEVKAHRAGQALLALTRNSVDLSGRIIGATGHYLILKSSAEDVEAFRRQVEILDMIGTIDIDKIAGFLVS